MLVNVDASYLILILFISPIVSSTPVINRYHSLLFTLSPSKLLQAMSIVPNLPHTSNFSIIIRLHLIEVVRISVFVRRFAWTSRSGMSRMKHCSMSTYLPFSIPRSGLHGETCIRADVCLEVYHPIIPFPDSFHVSESICLANERRSFFHNILDFVPISNTIEYLNNLLGVAKRCWLFRMSLAIENRKEFHCTLSISIECNDSNEVQPGAKINSSIKKLHALHINDGFSSTKALSIISFNTLGQGGQGLSSSCPAALSSRYHTKIARTSHKLTSGGLSVEGRGDDACTP